MSLDELLREYYQKFLPILIAVVIFVVILIAILFTWDKPVFVGNVYGAEIDTTKAVIHHTATPIDTTVESIRNHHINVNGWDDIGYHFLIKEDGSVVEGRSMFKQGAHAKGRNDYVGIALIGMDEFTEIQIAKLVDLLQRLNITYIERHHEECPGKGVDVELIQKYLIERQEAFKKANYHWNNPRSIRLHGYRGTFKNTNIPDIVVPNWHEVRKEAEEQYPYLKDERLEREKLSGKK